MKYEPKTDEQLAEEGLLPEGVYDFEVFSTEEKQSKSGKDMVVITLKVFDETGASRKATDYIVGGNHYGERKWRHAAASCGLLDKYEAGSLAAADFENKSGKLKMKIQKSDNPDYPLPKNAVDDYLPKELGAAAVPKKMDKAVEDDEIPF